MSFLDKANQDTGSSQPNKKDDNFAQTKSVDSNIPGSLKSLDAFYMSDSDEPFEPVALKFKSSSLDTGTAEESVESCGDPDTDPRSQAVSES